MPLIDDVPMRGGFPQIAGLGFQANGTIVGVADAPQGIPGKLEVQGDWMVSTLDESDAWTASGLRSEMYLSPDARGERWYNWEFMIPPGWSIDSHKFIVMQIHDSPNKAAPEYLPRHPTFLIYVEKATSEEELHFVVRVPGATLPTQSQDVRTVNSAQCEIGRVYRLCLHVNWQIDNTGFRELFIDGEPIMREYNVPTTYDDVTGGYLKLGVYRGSTPEDIGHRVAKYRSIQVWSGNDGYQTVMGGAPVPTRRLLIV